MAADSIHLPSGDNGGDGSIQPPWLAPYAERFFHRFPELFFTLGDPMLPQAFQLPTAGDPYPSASTAEVHESSCRKVVRVTLRHHSAGAGVTPDPSHRSVLNRSYPPPSWICAAGPCDNGCTFISTPPDLSTNVTSVRNAGATGMQLGSATLCSADSIRMMPSDGTSANGNCGNINSPQPSACGRLADSIERWCFTGGAAERCSNNDSSSEGPDGSKRSTMPFSTNFKNALDTASCKIASKAESSARRPSFSGSRHVDSRASTGLPSRGSKESLDIIASDEDGLSCSSLELPPSTLPIAKRSSLSRQRLRSQSPPYPRSVSWHDNIDGISTDTSSQIVETLLVDATRSSRSDQSESHFLYPEAVQERQEDSSATDKVLSVLSSGSVSPSSSQSPMNRRASLQNRRGLQLTLPLGEEEGRDTPSISSPENTTSLPSATNATKPAVGSPQWRMREAMKFASGGGFCKSPERNTPAVRLLTSDSKFGSSDSMGAVHRPLPGAFPHRRTIFFLDWDDTLCPTSWIRSHLKAHIADSQEWAEGGHHAHDQDFYHSIPGWFSQPLPDLPHVHEMMLDLQLAIINLITRAQAYGIVCIVTNAVEGWVERTIKKWLPKLKPYIFGHGYRPEIRVIYGQKVYKEPATELEDLPWVDECGPYMWWKKAAMTIALDEIDELYRLPAPGSPTCRDCIPWYANGDSKHIASVISIGDNDAEMQAPELAAIAHEERRCGQLIEQDASSPRGTPYTISSASPSRQSPWPWIKRIKLGVSPHAQQLITQLEEMVELLPRVVALRRHFQADLGQSEEIDDLLDEFCRKPPRPLDELCASVLLCEDEDITVEKALRTQSV